MSGLIDRQAAIDAIRASTSKYTGFMGMEMYTDDDAVEAIEAVPAASHWHRVEEELPPKGFALIGARKRLPETSEDVWDMWICEYDGEWGWQDMDGYALRGITHWMPIEPPKEEE